MNFSKFHRKKAPGDNNSGQDHDDGRPFAEPHHKSDNRPADIKVIDKHQGRDIDHSQCRQPDPQQDGKHGENHSPSDTPLINPSMAVLVGGEALAVGDDTITTGVINNTIGHAKGVTIAIGDAVFKAAGSSDTPGGAAAYADTYLNVAGADFIFGLKTNASGATDQNAWSQSEIRYIAIDIPNWSPPGGQTITNFYGLSLNAGEQMSHSGYATHGNVASILANATAYGAQTETATLTNALTVNNHLSLISGWALAIG